MALFGADSHSDGELAHRFSELEKDYKSLQQEHRNSDNELREALMHITLSALGTNSELDFQLKRLEVQLKDQQDAKQLQTTAEIIRELKKQSNAQFGSELNGVIKQLIEYAYQLPDADKIRTEVGSIEKQVARASNLEMPRLLQGLTAVIKRTLEVRIEKKAPQPWYKQLFNRKQAQQLHLEPVLTVLNFLLNHIKVPPELDSEYNAIRSLINAKQAKDSQEETSDSEKVILDHAGPIGEEDVLQALDLTSQLVIKVHRNNERQFNRFIEEINNQIGFMEELLFKQEQSNIISQEETKQFDNTIAQNFNEIQNNIKSSDNLEVLRQSVSGSISGLMSKVKDYSKKQSKRASDSEKEIRRLNERLRETEIVTNQLVDELSRTSKEAMSDALTGLPNRAAYDKRIEEEYARWQRFKHPLTVIVCDIDHFKQVNDTYGHKAGDKVIQTLAKSLKENLRRVDFIARYGGEEFVILLEKTSRAHALEVAEKLRVKIAELGFHFNEKRVQITMSFGVTQFKEGDSSDSAFERADRALYKSKENGRNQVNALE